MVLTDIKQRIKKSWDKGYGEGNAHFTTFKGLFENSELLILTLLITTLWILITHNLTQTERLELQTKIQRLQWLLTECIGIEEYELCSQIRNVIQRKYELLSTNQNANQIE